MWGVGGAIALEAMRHSRPEGFSDPEEARRLLTERSQALRTGSYGELCAGLRAHSPIVRMLGLRVGVTLERRRHETERLAGPSGTDYIHYTTMRLKRQGGPLKVSVLIRGADGSGRLYDEFLIEPACG